MIVTRDEVKTFLKITGTTSDALIDELIPEAERLYLLVRGIPFFIIYGTLTDASNIITDLYEALTDEYRQYVTIAQIQINDTIESQNEALTENIRSVVKFINYEDNEIVTLDDSTATVTEDLIIYPGSSKLVASKIVGYLLSSDSGNGVKSESIGNYSYTKFDPVSGLPVDITNMIQQYQSMK